MNNQMNQNKFYNNNMQFIQNNNNNNFDNEIKILKNTLNQNINSNLIVQVCKKVIENNQFQNKSEGIIQQLRQNFGCEWFAFVVPNMKDNYEFKFSNNKEILIFDTLQYQVYVCPL